MFSVGEIIDGKYRVRSFCSDLGGMGTILHVDQLAGTLSNPIVLKYCKLIDGESKKRFSREVRYLADFVGNSKILQVLDSNLSMDPPYFVMWFYPEGDLSALAVRIQSDVVFQERIFNKMLDCIAELHARGLQHRDIKPQNFLVDGDNIVVSDLGLAKQVGAGTTFTMSHEYMGTQGYLPPEFLNGSFKESTTPSDIFMLGKTFYSLLSGRDPIYLTDLGIHPAIYHVIERCCDLKVENRYPSIPILRQDMMLAYDVILSRAKGIGTVRQMLSSVVNRLNTEQQYDPQEINDFLDLLAKLPDDERFDIIKDMSEAVFYIFPQEPLELKLSKFLDQYEDFTENAVRTWSYAETVAKHMKIIFDRSSNIGHRAKALEIAIKGAVWANRFAAMDTCVDMITDITDNDLAIAVSAVISRNRGTFIDGIEPSRCKNDTIGNAIQAKQDNVS